MRRFLAALPILAAPILLGYPLALFVLLLGSPGPGVCVSPCDDYKISWLRVAVLAAPELLALVVVALFVPRATRDLSRWALIATVISAPVVIGVAARYPHMFDSFYGR
jgi:hypothetical protein